MTLAVGCRPSDIQCGDGTHLEGDTCVADEEADADTDSDTDTDTDTDTDSDADVDRERRVVAYYTEWSVYDRDYPVGDIPGELVTHINYAFFDVTSTGECEIYDSWAFLSLNGGNAEHLAQFKADNPDVRVLMAVGGWTLSGNFSAAAESEQSREAFAQSCVDIMTTYGFDGIDIDWEYPVQGGLYDGVAADYDNYPLLLAELRSAMDAQGGGLLTIAGAAGEEALEGFDRGAILAEVDWVNLMTYDFRGSWSDYTAFHNPLYPASDSPFSDEDTTNVDAAVQTWLSGGTDPDQLVVGMPLYGRAFANVGATDDGLFQSYSGVPSGTWEAGVYDVDHLESDFVGQGDWVRGFHEESMVPWLYSPSEQIFISYDDSESIEAKLDYIRTEDLGGAMVWELSADSDGHDLMEQLHAGMVGDGS